MTTMSEQIFFPNQALLFDLEQVYRCLQTVPDRRKRRGRRSPLAVLLMIGGTGQIGWTSVPPCDFALGPTAETGIEPPVPIEAAGDAVLLHLEPRTKASPWPVFYRPEALKSTQARQHTGGRLEQRTITVSSLLAGYSDFPYLAQVFRLESWAHLPGDSSRHEIRYGLTSLPAAIASPERLLALVRGQWGSENCLHYRREATMREDHSQRRMGHAPHLLALLNNTVVGLMARQGSTNLAELRREFAYQFDHALATLVA